MKKNIRVIVRVLIVLTTLLLAITWFVLLQDLNSVATDAFDAIKWLDADLFLINNVLTISIVSLVFLIIVNFIFDLINRRELKD